MKIHEIGGKAWTFLLLFCLTLLVTSPLHAESTEDAFWSRHWEALEQMALDNAASLSFRDRALRANSLWLQKRWEESLQAFQTLRPDIPEDVRPYADMLILLGLERTGRGGEAFAHGKAFFPEAPGELKYYVAFAMVRLSPAAEREKWYREMLSLATEDRQRVTAYEGLLAIPGDRVEDAVALLRLRSLHPRALEILGAVSRKDRSPEIAFSLGYAAFLQGDFSGALDALGDVPADHALSERAAYYRGMAHYRKKEYEEAFSAWKGLVLHGRERYASAAVKRLAILSGTTLRESALALLEHAASVREDGAGKGALFHLSKRSGDEQEELFLDRLARSYPLSDEVAELFWEQGWESWKAGDRRKALEFWDRGLEEERYPSREAQLLYWSGRALEVLGREDEARGRFERLLELHPGSYYSRLAFPGRDMPLEPGIPEMLKGAPSPLETWGFVHYARLRYLATGTPRALWRAARLASWMGDDRSAFLYASSVAGRLDGGAGSFAPLLEFLYPRPYRTRVSELGQRFGVEDLLVWALIRQESGFDPQALSWVGASGLMQLMPATARDEARKLGQEVTDLSRPDENLLLGVSHLSGLLKRFPRLDWAVAAYNAGGGSVGRWIEGREKVPPEEWIEDIPYAETRHYVKKVLGNLYVYRQIYGKGQEVSN